MKFSFLSIFQQWLLICLLLLSLITDCKKEQRDIESGIVVGEWDHNRELTKGKALYSQGTMEVHQDARDAMIGAIPVEMVEACAKAIVRSARRGDRYLTELSRFKGVYYLKAFCPEVVEWCYRMLVCARPGSSAAEVLNIQMVDLSGAKSVMYPPSIHSAEIKAD